MYFPMSFPQVDFFFFSIFSNRQKKKALMMCPATVANLAPPHHYFDDLWQIPLTRKKFREALFHLFHLFPNFPQLYHVVLDFPIHLQEECEEKRRRFSQEFLVRSLSWMGVLLCNQSQKLHDIQDGAGDFHRPESISSSVTSPERLDLPVASFQMFIAGQPLLKNVFQGNHTPIERTSGNISDDEK